MPKFIIVIILTFMFTNISLADIKDSIQPNENLDGSIVKPENKEIILNVISNFGKVEVPTSTIIIHANNDFSIFRFEKNIKGLWHLAQKDTVIRYNYLGSKLVLNLQDNLAIKKSSDRTKMIIIVNVPAKWTTIDSKVQITLKPWTTDRVGRLNEYNPGSLLDWEKNLREIYNSIRIKEFSSPGMVVKNKIQQEFNLINIGDLYISKGLISKLTSKSYVANKFVKSDKSHRR